MSQQQQVDFDAIMKRVEAELRKPGGLVEQFQHQFDTLANEACSTRVELSNFEAATEDRLSRLEAKIAKIQGDCAAH